MNPDKKNKMLAAKPDVDAVIKKYGLASVKYVVNRRIESARLLRQWASEKDRLRKRIEEIESKLKRK